LTVIPFPWDIHFHGGGARKLFPMWAGTIHTLLHSFCKYHIAGTSCGCWEEPLTPLPHHSHKLNPKRASFDTNLYSKPPGSIVISPLVPWQPLYRCHETVSWLLKEKDINNKLKTV
jgi:hypothetical protein